MKARFSGEDRSEFEALLLIWIPNRITIRQRTTQFLVPTGVNKREMQVWVTFVSCTPKGKRSDDLHGEHSQEIGLACLCIWEWNSSFLEVLQEIPSDCPCLSFDEREMQFANCRLTHWAMTPTTKGSIGRVRHSIWILGLSFDLMDGNSRLMIHLHLFWWGLAVWCSCWQTCWDVQNVSSFRWPGPCQWLAVASFENLLWKIHSIIFKTGASKKIHGVGAIGFHVSRDWPVKILEDVCTLVFLCDFEGKRSVVILENSSAISKFSLKRGFLVTAEKYWQKFIKLTHHCTVVLALTLNWWERR